jgi:putative flippase GtrA
VACCGGDTFVTSMADPGSTEKATRREMSMQMRLETGPLASVVAWLWRRAALRYLCVGSTLFVIGTVVVVVTVRLLGWDVRIAETVSRMIGAFLGFFAHRYVTFAARAQPQRAGILSQGTAYIVLTVVNVLVAPWVLYCIWSLLDHALVLSKVLTEVVMLVETFLVLRVIFLSRSRPSVRH